MFLTHCKPLPFLFSIPKNLRFENMFSSLCNGRNDNNRKEYIHAGCEGGVRGVLSLILKLGHQKH